MKLPSKVASAAVGTGLICLLPFYIPDHYLCLLILTFLNAYLALSWNIIGGMAGQLSLGHAAFFGLGGYTTAFLFQNYGLTPWVGMWIGVAVAAIYGALVALLCFRYRVRGTYFALITIAFVEVLRIIAVNLKFLGGSEGIIIPLKGHCWKSMQFENKIHYYFLILLMTAALISALHYLRNSRFISYLKAIREDEDVAQALGIDLFRTKFRGFVVSAGLTALGGTFYTQYLLYIDPPSMLGMIRSFDMVFICIIGGMGTVFGPLLGAIVFSILMEVGNLIFKGGDSANHLILYGVLLMVVIMAFPRGLISLFPKRIAWSTDVAKN